MKSQSLAIISFLLVEILFIKVSCFASTYQLQDEINAYNKNDFNSVISIGRLLENEALDTEFVHYYLANAYSHLNRIPEAIQEYTVCWREGKDPKIITYSQQALRAFQSSKNSGAIAQVNYQTNPSVNDAQGQSNQLATKQRIMQEGENEVNSIIALSQKQIDALNITRDQDMAAVPKYFPTSYPNQKPQPNPDYESTVNAINTNAQLKIDSINEILNKNVSEVRDAYQARIAALNSSMSNMNSQLQSGNSDIQLTAVGSNIYVKNYVNYGIDPPAPPSPVGLKAEQKSLILKTPQTIKARKPSV